MNNLHIEDTEPIGPLYFQSETVTNAKDQMAEHFYLDSAKFHLILRRYCCHDELILRLLLIATLHC